MGKEWSDLSGSVCIITHCHTLPFVCFVCVQGGETPLLAAGNGRLDCVVLLVQAGADTNKVSYVGQQVVSCTTGVLMLTVIALLSQLL